MDAEQQGRISDEACRDCGAALGTCVTPIADVSVLKLNGQPPVYVYQSNTSCLQSERLGVVSPAWSCEQALNSLQLRASAPCVAQRQIWRVVVTCCTARRTTASCAIPTARTIVTNPAGRPLVLSARYTASPGTRLRERPSDAQRTGRPPGWHPPSPLLPSLATSQCLLNFQACQNESKTLTAGVSIRLALQHLASRVRC